jgi:hypothetical protein
MPRGSKPGERRGGRQRGTPNKKTLLKDAVLCAAAQPNSSPVDFMLGLMRDSKVPMELRIEMAAAAAPYVHTRPDGLGRKRPPATKSDAAIKISRVHTLPNFSPQIVEAGLNGAVPGAAAGSADLAPLAFLISVMNDLDARPPQRIKAARIAAPYLHARPHPDQMPIVIEDPFGFDVDPAVARAIRDADLRLTQLFQKRYAQKNVVDEPSPEEIDLKSQIAERVKTLRCPAGYGPKEHLKDRNRLCTLFRRRISPPPYNTLTETEDAEEAHLTARIAVYEASPEGQARTRISALGL